MSASRIIKVVGLAVCALAVTILVTALVIYLAGERSSAPRLDGVVINSHYIQTDVADTKESLIEGLSGVKSLDLNQALVLDFGSEGDRRIWMKDMLISIDAVWVSQAGQIVHLEDNLPVEDPPRTSYLTANPARYVIELNDQAIEEFSIKMGDSVRFIYAD